MPVTVIAKIKQQAGTFKLLDAEDVNGAGYCIVFPYSDLSLAVAVFLPRPAMRLLDKMPVPTAEANQRFSVTANVAGTGTNTIKLYSTTTSPFTGAPGWTERASAALSTLKIIEVTSFGGWTWNPATEYLKVECTAVGGTAPQEVVAYFEWE